MSKSELDQLWELQGRQAELRRHVLQLTSQLTTAERERAIIDISIRELDALEAPDPVLYHAVGKMFLLKPTPSLRALLLDSKEQSLARDEGRTSLRTQFIQKLKESESRIDEIADNIEAGRVSAAHNSGTSANK